MNTNMNQYINNLLELDKQFIKYENSIKIIENDYPDEKISSKKYNDRKDRLNKENIKNIEAVNLIMSKINNDIQNIRNAQPHLSTLSISKKENFPNFLVFGRINIHSPYLLHNKNKFIPIPRVISFPITKALYSRNNESIEYVKQLIIRILQVSPLKKLNFTLIDTLKLGESFDFIREILDNDFIYKQRILTYSDEIEIALKNMADYLESLIQKQLTGYDDWSSYNAKNPKTILPLKILAIISSNEFFTKNSLIYLERLIEHGPKYGILPVIIMKNSEKESAIDKKLTEFAVDIENTNMKLKEKFQHLTLEDALESWPSNDELKKLLSNINNFYKIDSQIKYEIDEFWSENNFWNNSSVNGVFIPIGWDKNQEKIELKIGYDDSEHHTLIGGRSGSGKSNLLHTIIQNCSYLYSPDEVELFLLDYKEGIEFNSYANAQNPLPHASLIAIQSDIEYGKTFLEYIVKEKNRRAELFKQESVKDFKEYRNKNLKLSRQIIIIDEFQVLFTIKKSKPIEDLFVEILRKGRSYGIHLILATQTLRGIEANSISQLKSQIGNRIALVMGEEDSMSVLSSNNTDASKLKGKPEAIFNNLGGVKDGNRLIFIPYASRYNLEKLLKKTKAANFKKTIKIYNGEQQIPLPNNDEFITEAIELLVGRSVDFDERPFKIKFNKEPGNSLIISGRGINQKKNIVKTVMLNLKCNQKIKNIYFISNNLTKYYDKINCDKVKIVSTEIFNDILQNDSFIVIDNFEMISELHPKATSFSSKEASVADKFAEILENGYENNIYTIIFIENYKRAKEKANKILQLCELRYGFNINDDTASALLSSTMTPMDSIPPNKAVFANLISSELTSFKFFGVFDD